MKKLLVISAGVGLGGVIVLTGIICLIYLTSSSTVSIDVRNDSKAVLHNVTLILPDWPDTRMDEMLPGQSFGPGMPSRMKMSFRVVFDDGGHHYDVPAQVRLLPFGSYTLFITIDDHMQVSVRTIHFMGG
jgi:hypothetical protein